MNKCSEIIKEVNAQLKNLLTARAVFPHTREDLIGTTRSVTAPFYQKRGFSIAFEFAEPLTKQRIDELNQVGHWINQNYIVRLYALLESFQVVSNSISINTTLSGHEDVDILRRLRREFAHSSGWYDRTDPEERKLKERIIEYYSLEIDHYPASDPRFPIPIDGVLLPMTDACKTYVQSLFPDENNT
jgi:hypothetical protein